MSLALLFPGQGSQAVGMGGALARSDPLAAELLERADEVLGFPLSTLMLEGPEEELRMTKNAQPALLTHSVAVLRAVEDRIGPVAVAAGHSLGEFSAHVAAGTIGFEDALQSVRLRGELMYESGQARPGGMAAVLGLDEAQVDAVCARVDAGVCVPANYNSAAQVVISGDVAGIEQATGLAKEAGARKVLPLNVSGAFHSPLMEPAVSGLRARLEAIDFRPPRFPVVSNATAELVTDADRARELLLEQITSAVRWTASVRTMVGSGADRFLELGPGSVLCGLVRRNANGAVCAAVGGPDDFAALEA